MSTSRRHFLQYSLTEMLEMKMYCPTLGASSSAEACTMLRAGLTPEREAELLALWAKEPAAGR